MPSTILQEDVLHICTFWILRDHFYKGQSIPYWKHSKGGNQGWVQRLQGEGQILGGWRTASSNPSPVLVPSPNTFPQDSPYGPWAMFVPLWPAGTPEQAGLAKSFHPISEVGIPWVQSTLLRHSIHFQVQSPTWLTALVVLFSCTPKCTWENCGTL